MGMFLIQKLQGILNIWKLLAKNKNWCPMFLTLQGLLHSLQKERILLTPVIKELTWMSKIKFLKLD